MELFLVLWAITLLLPFIHLFVSEVWGECYWNATPTLYYFSGFIGYAVLAAYIKRFWMAPSLRLDWIAIGMVVAGYSVTLAGFLYRLRYEREVKSLELTRNFTTLNVAVMTAGIFLLFRNLRADRGNTLLWRTIDDLSRMSYGMYLAHIIVLNAIHSLVAPLIESAHTNDRIHNLRDYLSRGQAALSVAVEQIPRRISLRAPDAQPFVQ